MIRLLIFILSAIFVAGAATILAGIDGRIVAEAFGRKFDVHTGFAVGVLIIAFILAVAAASFVKDLYRTPRVWSANQLEERRIKGLKALTRGFEAIAVGDGAAAARHARTAERLLENASMTRLLSAQAAQLAGDEAAAKASFAAMLAAPESELLGLKGLYLQAQRAGDVEAARGYAERAFHLRPDAAWAFDSVFSLALDRGAWGEARDILAAGRRHEAIDPPRARRGEAALLTADAYAAAAIDPKLAFEETERALKMEPAFAPAAALAGQLAAAQGRRSRAIKILERAFAAAPHLALVDVYADQFSGLEASRRPEALRNLAARAPGSEEARVLEAMAALARGDSYGASAALEPLLRVRETARLCALMAEAAGKSGAPDAEAVAAEWLRRAALAPRDWGPGERAFQFTRAGWAQLIRTYIESGRLAHPPLDVLPRGVPDAEIQRLLARPPQPSEPAATAAVLPSGGAATPRADGPNPAAMSEASAEGARAVTAAGEVS